MWINIVLFPLLHGVMNISEWTHNVSSEGPNQPNHYQNPLSSKIKVKESFIGLLTIFSWMITNWGRAKNLVWQFHLTTIVSLLEISQRIGILMNSLRSFPNTHVSRKTAGIVLYFWWTFQKQNITSRNVWLKCCVASIWKACLPLKEINIKSIFKT